MPTLSLLLCLSALAQTPPVPEPRVMTHPFTSAGYALVPAGLLLGVGAASMVAENHPRQNHDLGVGLAFAGFGAAFAAPGLVAAGGTLNARRLNSSAVPVKWEAGRIAMYLSAAADVFALGAFAAFLAEEPGLLVGTTGAALALQGGALILGLRQGALNQNAVEAVHLGVVPWADDRRSGLALTGRW